jgi:hypothetical protein
MGLAVDGRRAAQRVPGAEVAPYRGPGRLRPPVLGVDVGGVIVTLAGRDEDTSFFGTRPLETPAVAGVFEALAALCTQPFGGRVHVVSKAGPKVAANTRAWLAHHRFFERTGVAAANLHFVRERRDKAPVCERLQVTHFVDDRLDVLGHLTTVDHRYLFVGGSAGDATGDAAASEVPEWVTVADAWSKLVAVIRESDTGTATARAS